MSKNKKSMIFIIVLLVISAVLFAMLLFMQNSGDQVVISIDGEEYGTYPLNKDQTIRIDQGKDYNIVEIKDGKVDMIESTCKNQICVNDAPISKDYPGTIVCLPHKLIVEIKE